MTRSLIPAVNLIESASDLWQQSLGLLRADLNFGSSPSLDHEGAFDRTSWIAFNVVVSYEKLARLIFYWFIESLSFCIASFVASHSRAR